MIETDLTGKVHTLNANGESDIQRSFSICGDVNQT